MTHTSIVSYHTNPYTCGVARFNHALARTMNLPLLSLKEYLEVDSSQEVLLSLKTEEMSPVDQDRLSRALVSKRLLFDLLLHGYVGTELERSLCVNAKLVAAASREIADQVKGFREDVYSVFAPGAPEVPPAPGVDCTLLTFGMAHKIRSQGYLRLAELIAGDPRSFRLDISTALHEGGTFDKDFFTVNSEISHVFAGNVRFLGFLADSEVSERLRTASALVAFFPRGARENNTTVLSAMAHGCPVVTNVDEKSPSWMVHNETIFDVEKLKAFPGKRELERVSSRSREIAKSLTFQELVNQLHKSRS